MPPQREEWIIIFELPSSDFQNQPLSFREKLVTVIWPKSICQVQVRQVQTLPWRGTPFFCHTLGVFNGLVTNWQLACWGTANTRPSINLDQKYAELFSLSLSLSPSLYSLYAFSNLYQIRIYDIRLKISISIHLSIEISVSKLKCNLFSLSLSICLLVWLTDLLNEGPKGQSKEEAIGEPTTIEPSYVYQFTN